MIINNKEYDTEGLLTDKNPNIEYRLIIGNVLWGILLVETIIAPIYFFGYSIFEPVGVRCKEREIGVIYKDDPCAQ